MLVMLLFLIAMYRITNILSNHLTSFRPQERDKQVTPIGRIKSLLYRTPYKSLIIQFKENMEQTYIHEVRVRFHSVWLTAPPSTARSTPLAHLYSLTRS